MQGHWVFFTCWRGGYRIDENEGSARCPGMVTSVCMLTPPGACCVPRRSVIPSQRRRHVGRCVLSNGRAYTLSASCPEDRWTQVGPLVQAVVSTFRS